ncbi:hypothetical protein QLX08_007604 [Tetragonisca angustula]|uniref:Uncharacterized protein n=1 Tax=Tetragonisca angustula TaxID=166442 RepID=A0AAW0ZNV6_9HYME
METHLGRFAGVWVVLFFCGFPACGCGTFPSKDFEGKLIVLSKTVDYINQRTGQMNADVTLSLTIVEANVAAIFLHKNARHLLDEHRNSLMTILKLCDSTRRDLLDAIVPENKDVQLLHETINYPILWLKEISWRRGALEEGKTNLKLTYRDVRELIMQGAPKEKESDRCLADIVRYKLNSNDRVPGLCVEILTSRKSARGYPLTHRLLIVLIAKILKCDRDLPSSALIPSYCSAILQDLIDVKTAGFPDQTPDLMMEQVVLCGMQGFLEFTDKYYEQLVLSWSHPSGCFSSFGYVPVHPIVVFEF